MAKCPFVEQGQEFIIFSNGCLEPEFYGDLIYKFKRVVRRTDFSDQFRKIIVRYKRIGNDMNAMQQSACLVVNPVTSQM